MQTRFTTLVTAAVLGIWFAPANAQNFNASPPNAPDQRPAFADQTRAPIVRNTYRLRYEIIADGLDTPWGMTQLPDGAWLVSERVGNLRIVDTNGDISAPIDGLPDVDSRGQGGLLDVAIREDFDQTGRIWWSFSEPRRGGRTTTSVATGVLSADRSAIEDATVIFRQEPDWNSQMHYGSRLVFDNDGALFVTTGERSKRQPRQLAQDVSTHIGKVLRINPMGGPASGNPQIQGGLPEIWSYGHRNIQGAALAPDGSIWTVEHGPRGGDELNQPQPGLNYGWPVVTYGTEYNGRPVGDGLTQAPGIEQPVYYWDPVIAPSGMVFYDGDMFPDWNGNVLIGGLASQALVRLELDGDRVSGEARLFIGENRIRDVDVAQDGSIMMLTDSGSGQLVRVSRIQ